MWKYGIGATTFIMIAAFGYWAISPLFKNVKANDQLPGTEANEIVTTTGGSGGDKAMATATESTSPAAVRGTAAHPASGTVRIVSADGKAYVRYENFKTINGPDIFVYLAKDLDAKDFVNLGQVKATEGDINYEIPAGVDPREYPYVLTWCKAFGVLFNSAKVY